MKQIWHCPLSGIRASRPRSLLCQLGGRAGCVYVQEALLRMSFYRRCKTQKAPGRSSCKQFLHTATHLRYETEHHNLCVLAQIGWIECVTLCGQGAHGIRRVLSLSTLVADPSVAVKKACIGLLFIHSHSWKNVDCAQFSFIKRYPIDAV